MKILRQCFTITIVTLSLFFLIYSHKSAAVKIPLSKEKPDNKISQSIENILTVLKEVPETTIEGESIYAPEMLRQFYRKRNFLPVWSYNNNLSLAKELSTAIATVTEHGLNSEHYHLQTIKYLIERTEYAEHADIKASTDLDLLLTDAYFKIGEHLSSGSIDPVSIEAKWYVRSEKPDMLSILDEALKNRNIRDSLLDLLPPQQRYENLKKSLEQYRELAANGDWPPIHLSILFKEGVRHRTVKEIKERLTLFGDLKDGINIKTDLFDDILEQAVIRFQKRHALKADGVVGPETAKAMNISAGKRARQIEANLERMRWMSRIIGHQYIEVNIADFKLHVHEYGHTILSMDVVVGKPFWDTPVFSDRMTYIVINPAWNIPQTIAWREIIPEIKTDADYLLHNNIKIVKSLYDFQEIRAGSINWDDFTEQNLPYWFRQEPGGRNPLGRIKFMFPNRFNVYLHDTPAKHLFTKSSRAFSHGCIRVRNPVSLAEYVLNGIPEWTRSQIMDIINSGQTRKVYLPKPINVHIVYLTSWIDNEGVLQFRNDIYNRDERLYTALLSKPSTLN